MSKNSTISESLIRIHLDNQRESFEVFKKRQAEAKLQTDLNTEETTIMPIVEGDSKTEEISGAWPLWIWILLFAVILLLLWKFLSRIFVGIREYRELQEETEKTYEYLQKKYEEEALAPKIDSQPKGESAPIPTSQSPLYQELIANQEVKF